MTVRSRVGNGAIPLIFGILAFLFWKFRIAAGPLELTHQSTDTYCQIYPMWLAAARWMRSGILPLWNPYQFCGHPFLATELYGVLYPLNFLRLVLPVHVAIEAAIVVHLFLAASFTYWYGRVVGLSCPGSFVAAVAFSLSGFLANEALWFAPAIASAVWLPLGLLAVEKILDEGRWLWVALLGVAVAMPILSGWMQTWLYTVHAIGFYSAARLVEQLIRSNYRIQVLRLAALLAAGATLGFVLAAAQVLPSLELQLQGPRRPGGLALIQTLAWGPVSPQWLLSQAVDSVRSWPCWTYVGMLGLVLMPMSVLTRSNRFRMVFMWFLAAWSVAVALTVYTPVFTLYRLLPGGSWFRTPWRIIFLYAFAGAALMGIGFDALAQPDRVPERWRRLLAVVLSGAVAVAFLVGVDMPSGSRVCLAIGLMLVWAAAIVRDQRLRYVVRAGVIVLLVADLFFGIRNHTKHPYNDLSPYDGEREALEAVKGAQGLSRTYIHWPWVTSPALTPKQGTLRGIYSITDYEMLTLERFGKFYRLLARPTPGQREPLPFIGVLDLEPGPEQLRLLDLMSVRFVVTPKVDAAFARRLEQGGWERWFFPRTGDFMVYVNPRTLPRAYVAFSPQLVTAESEALKAIAAPGFDRWRGVIIEYDSGTAHADLGGDGPGRPIAPAQIVGYAPTHVVAEVEIPAPGYLVLTDSFYPGWRVTVDGQAAAVYRANYLFRGVHVPAGKHTVAFRYVPVSFEVGATLSALACAGVAIAFTTSGLRRWRSVLDRKRRPIRGAGI